MRSTNGRRVAAAARPWALRLAGVAVAASLTLGVAACQAQPKSFPGAIPGMNTDVSSDQAFKHFQIVPPATVRNLRYSAASKDDTYPMVAIFDADCRDTPAFVSGSGLRQAPSALEMPIGDVESFAKRNGWTESSTGNSWYYRKNGQNTIEVLIRQAATTCTVYVTA